MKYTIDRYKAKNINKSTWGRVFVDQAHLAIPATRIQLEDAAPGIKMRRIRSILQPWQIALMNLK